MGGLLSSWVILGILLGTTSAGLPWFSVTPSSARIISGTAVHMGCGGCDTQYRGHYIIKGSGPYIPDYAINSQFTVDATMTDNYRCCCITWAKHLGYTHTCSSPHSITVVPKTPVLSSDSTRLEFGESITLICDADERAGPPTVKYKFMHNSTVLYTGTTRSYTFTADDKSNGHYTCAVLADTHISGTVSSPQSPQVTITVHMSTPALQSTHRRPLSGDLVTLTCSIQLLVTLPHTSVVYKFMQDAVVIQTVTQNVFSFNATPRSSGDYTCEACVGTVVSNPSTQITISVTPTTTPTPTQPPTTRRPIHFECQTAGPNAVVDYPFPYDPEQFIHCTPDGKAYIETCPQGIQWNQAVRKCEAPITHVG